MFILVGRVLPIGSCRLVAPHFEVRCQAEQGQQLDTPVVEIHLPPGHAVAGRYRMSMVIVVPALAASQQRYPPVICGVISGLEAAGTPPHKSRSWQTSGQQNARGSAK